MNEQRRDRLLIMAIIGGCAFLLTCVLIFSGAWRQ